MIYRLFVDFAVISSAPWLRVHVRYRLFGLAVFRFDFIVARLSTASKTSNRIKQSSQLRFKLNSPCKDHLVLNQVEMNFEKKIKEKVFANNSAEQLKSDDIVLFVIKCYSSRWVTWLFYLHRLPYNRPRFVAGILYNSLQSCISLLCYFLNAWCSDDVLTDLQRLWRTVNRG